MVLRQCFDEQCLQFQKDRSVGFLRFVILQHVGEAWISTVGHRCFQLEEEEAR